MLSDPSVSEPKAPAAPPAVVPAPPSDAKLCNVDAYCWAGVTGGDAAAPCAEVMVSTTSEPVPGSRGVEPVNVYTQADIGGASENSGALATLMSPLSSFVVSIPH